MAFFQTLFDWYMANLNYFTIGLLMLIESTFLPLPSEVVIPFAAYKAGQGDLNVFIVVLMGTMGALTGSLINYTLAYYLGRPIVYRFAGSRLGKMFLLSEEKVKHAEEYFIRNGKTSTFIGAGMWNIILAIIGYYLYAVREQIFPYVGHILLAVGIIFVVYLIVKAQKNKRKL